MQLLLSLHLLPLAVAFSLCLETILRITGKDGRNLTGQLDMGCQYAIEQGYDVVEELAEDSRGASGAEMDLPKLNCIRDMASSGAFDVLVVREIDRLSRNLAKQLIVEQELQSSGVKIEYVIGQYPDTPEGNFNKHIRATVAEYEREQIRVRTTRARHQKAKAWHVMTHGRAPYGYKLAEENGKRTLEILEAEASVVKMIFRWFTVGDDDSGLLSLRAVAERLTTMRVPTKADCDARMVKRREYGKWSRTTVRQMLKRETYAGTFHYGKVPKNNTGRVENPRDTRIPVKVPAIVSHET